MDRTMLAVVGALVMSIGMSRTLSASEHFVVITDPPHGSHARVFADVAAEVPTDLVIQILPAGASTTLTVDFPALAATSEDLLALAGGATTLVRIATLDPTVRSSVVLREETSTTEVALAVPDVNRTAGGRFELPVGPLGDQSFVLIGNPNPQDIDFLYRFGIGANQAGRVDARGALRLDLPSDTARLVISTGGGTASPPLILQYGNDLKDLVVTFVPPI
jgi:hypothetical protein